MKLREPIFILVLMLVQVLIDGCGNTNNIPRAPSYTITPALVHSVRPELTLTPITATPTPSLTPTAIPTLSVDQARKKMLDLLANNGGCRLPCLWGITPGKSTYQEAQTVLAPLSSISDLTGFGAKGGSIDPLYAEDDLMLITNVGFNVDTHADDQIVSRIGFQAREFKKGKPSNVLAVETLFNSKTFGARLHLYMLSQVLSEQGIPTAVLISTNGGANLGNNVPGFYILLFYPDQGILVSYTTNKQLVGGNLRGCPANAHVGLELFSSGHGDSFSEFLSQTQWANLWPVPADSPNWKPVEKATSMSIEQFYETFRQPTDKCIDTPAKLWPTPKP